MSDRFADSDEDLAAALARVSRFIPLAIYDEALKPLERAIQVVIAQRDQIVTRAEEVLDYENHPSRLSLSRLRHALRGTRIGTSVESETDDPQNTGSKPEVKPKLFFIPHDSYPQD